MVDEEHLVRLRAGVEAWNAWRKEHPKIFLNLSGADLRDANLSGANLSWWVLLHKADLRGADLRGADLSCAGLSSADLSGANLGGANLIGLDLNGADLSGANLSDANLSGATFQVLHETIYRKANLGWANLSGANLSRADLSGANLSDANLSDANLSGANLGQANLSRIDLSGANLRGANLSRTDLRKIDLSKTNLRGANLSGADLRGMGLGGMDLSGTQCCDTDLRQAMLIDSCLDGADLTGAKLWETQRSGWSIKGVTCQRVFWDRDGNESTEYEAGDFERIFAEKPRIVLRYLGGILPVDLAMLPLIVERLQAEHPDYALHIRSVQDDGSGATVTITVDDLTGRKDDAFIARLQAELEYVLEDRDYYRQLISSMLADRIRLPFQEIHLHNSSGVITMSSDTYNIPGQAGAVGPHSRAHDMTFQQIQNSLDLPKLAEELGRLRTIMKQESQGTREQDKAVAAVAEAEEAAIKGDARTALQHLKTVGKWTLGIAEKIGVPLAVEALKRMIGPT